MAIDINSLAQSVQQNAQTMEALGKTLNTVLDKLSKTPAPGTPSSEQVFGLPNVRHGEDPLSSRGYSLLKMFGHIRGILPADKCKVELDFHNRLHNAYCKEMRDGYDYKSGKTPGVGAFLAPLATSFMDQDVISREFRHEMRQRMVAGADGADPNEVQYYRRKMLESMGYSGKALSWLTDRDGGALVQPPEQGEIIELLRSKEALINAGARVVPLPPQGRMVYPRQTGAGLAYWVGENQQIAESQITLGEVTLQAKKLAVLMKVPNELIRFASPAAESLLRDDMTKDLALGLDLAALEGIGSDKTPRGITRLPGLQQIDSSTQSPDGDTVVGQDLYRAIATIEEVNAKFEGWIMRPKTLYKYYQLRSDAVAQGDAAGPFLFNLIREPGDGAAKPTLAGYGVTTSTQVSGVQTKGNGTNLTYVLGGMFSEVMLGMFGAIEFAQTNLGDTPFQYDQTWVRALVTADVAVRHEAAFAWIPYLNTRLT